MFTNSHKATLYKAKRQPAAEGCLVKKQRSDFMDIEIKDGGTYRIYPIRLQGVALNAYD